MKLFGLITIFVLFAGLVTVGIVSAGGDPHHEQEDGCDHGATGKLCKDDPSDNGADCEYHGNNGGINENHCCEEEDCEEEEATATPLIPTATSIPPTATTPPNTVVQPTPTTTSAQPTATPRESTRPEPTSTLVQQTSSTAVILPHFPPTPIPTPVRTITAPSVPLTAPRSGDGGLLP